MQLIAEMNLAIVALPFSLRLPLNLETTFFFLSRAGASSDEGIWLVQVNAGSPSPGPGCFHCFNTPHNQVIIGILINPLK